jgi:hypothetical protein
MMKEHLNLPAGAAIEAAVEAAPIALDWRGLADQRLARVVEIEHDYSVMRDRLSRLQVDYRELLVASDDRLQRILELDKARQKLDERLGELAREYASMQASFIGSRSWRITRPLRALSGSGTGSRRAIGRLLRAMLRVPLLRRTARLATRLVPGLHARLRSRLYPQ